MTDPAAPRTAAEAKPDPEILRKVAQLRSALREGFGTAVMAMMSLPRYNRQSLADLQHLVLEPMLKDRVAFAYQGAGQDKGADPALPPDMAGFAIWASVSEEVDGRIRQQVSQGVFPIRLQAEDWNSGSINWLLDVITPSQKMTASILANFRQVTKEGELRLHPLISRLVDRETLEKMGARRAQAGGGEAAPDAPPPAKRSAAPARKPAKGKARASKA